MKKIHLINQISWFNVYKSIFGLDLFIQNGMSPFDDLCMGSGTGMIALCTAHRQTICGTCHPSFHTSAMSNDEHHLKKELYQRIQSSDEIFEFLQNGSLDGVWFWDVQNPESEWMSPRMWTALGYDPADKPHHPSSWQSLVFEEDLPIITAAVQAHLTDASHPVDEIIRYRNGHGRTSWIRCRGMAIRDDSGHPIRMLGTHTDVTALKQAEQELKDANIQLEARRVELEQFASIASHDLRAPVRQLGGLVQILQEDLHHLGIDDTNIHYLINLIVQRAKRALKMHDDLLEYARVGSAETTPVNISLDRMVNEIWSFTLQPGFTLNIPQPLPEVTLPRLPVMTVLRNLIQNAIQHHDRSDGTITIAAQQEGPLLMLTVSDDGPGIPFSQRAKAMAVFQTLKSRDRGGGSGLGLALVKRLVDRYGQGLSIAQNTPRGTTITTSWYHDPSGEPPSGR